MAEGDKPKNKGGRPRKHPVGTRVPTLAFRVRAGLRDKLEASAERSERSISEEIERRLEQSYEDDLLRGAGAPLQQALRKVMAKVLRLSADHVDHGDGSPEENEANVRRELRSALSFIVDVYTTTGKPLPEEISVDNMPSEWGAGDIGRLHAETWLEDWADDSIRLARARTGEVDFYWTPEPHPRSLDDIMAEKDGGRDRNASSPPRQSDSGPGEADDLPIEVPAPATEKPKRKRKAASKAS